MKSLLAIVLSTFLLPDSVTATALAQSLPLEQQTRVTEVTPTAPIRYKAVSPRKPSRRISRGAYNHCLSDAQNYGKKALIALVPENNPVLTTSENLKFFFYISKTPKTSVQALEFVLMDANKKQLYHKTLPVNDQPGVFSFSLPANLEKSLLKTDQVYRWYFAAICDYSQRSLDLVVTGWLKQIATDDNLRMNLKKARTKERAAIYASSGIWYDSLTTLAELRHECPNDTALKTDWQSLLQSVDLGEIAHEPIVGELNSDCSFAMCSHQPQ